MSAAHRSFSRGWALASCLPVLLLLGLVTGGSPSGSGPAGRPGAAASPGSPAQPVPPLPGLPDLPPSALGLAAERDGYRLDSGTSDLPADRAAGYAFTVTGPDGRPVTDFLAHQSEKLHFYAIRSDLTGFQHLHPAMAADGTWTADLAALTPGSWRLYASFLPAGGPGKSSELVLSRTVTVPGQATAVPLPGPAGSTAVDGYTVTLRSEPAAGAHLLTATVAKDGRPVTDLQPYLDSYAHLSAFHEGDQALAHLHPATEADSEHGGPTLTFRAMLGETGRWRVFLQFRAAGQPHTAELTLAVG
ncbi:hypothetical protein [Kitasatospora sp. NPDC059327]|uniref:hypothetical protein n=1 Tax=Kitasatospora sp. NPDC059327 TaxID=3346803 RepID=UPI00368BAAFE